MKTTALFLVLLAVTMVYADQAKMNAMLEAKAKAGDAVDTVMKVLNDLKQSALDERKELDKTHKQKEDFYAEQISELSSIRETNCNVFADATAHREYVEAEIEDTTNYLNWISDRFVNIDDLIQSLQDDRCESSLLFVTRVREHYEALDAIAMLRSDLKSWEMAGMPTLVEIDTMPSYNRLLAYTSMFKQDALDNFLALGQDTDGTVRERDGNYFLLPILIYISWYRSS